MPDLRKLMVAALVAGATLAAPVAAHAATSAAASQSVVTAAHACNENPLHAVFQCTTVHGSGLRIKSIDGYAYSNSVLPLSDLHIEIYYAGKHGDVKLRNCARFGLLTIGLRSPTCTWKNPHPGKNVRAGNYCSRTWENTGLGQFTILASECIDVHR